MTILASVNNKTVMPGITPIADVPDTPTIGTATSAGLAASVTFTAATTGGTPTTFTATSTPGSLTGTASSSPVTVSGLTEGTSYTFTVRANNSTGSSANSAASNSITAVSPITGGYDSLATVIVPSGGLSTITFSGIPTGYKHLQVRYIARTTYAQTNQDPVNMRFNSDSGSNYAYHRLLGDGVSALGTSATSQNVILAGIAARGSEPNNVFGVAIIDILDYAKTNKYKTTRTLIGENAGDGDEYVGMHSGLWMNTSAITSITFTTPNGNYSQYSQFALYGVK